MAREAEIAQCFLRHSDISELESDIDLLESVMPKLSTIHAHCTLYGVVNALDVALQRKQRVSARAAIAKATAA